MNQSTPCATNKCVDAKQFVQLNRVNTELIISLDHKHGQVSSPVSFSKYLKINKNSKDMSFSHIKSVISSVLYDHIVAKTKGQMPKAEEMFPFSHLQLQYCKGLLPERLKQAATQLWYIQVKTAR